jgi:hypothetical protein
MSGDRLEHLLRRPWRNVTLPPDAVGIPTMLSKMERKLLYTLARDFADGDAAIVDAGCFLGGSTAALLAGVRDRREPWSGPPVQSYDLFRVEAFTVPKFFPDDASVAVGQSFRSRFDAHVERFHVPHAVHEGDITEIGWAGEPIDILFLDVLKSWEINDAVLSEFFRSLVPGRSVIVHQDYGWAGAPWIPITVELMRDSLVLIDWMEWGSHVFFVERELPTDVVEKGVRNLDLDKRFELIDRAIEWAEGWVRGMLEIARTELVVERDGVDAALRDLSAIAERHPQHGLVLGCIANLRSELESAGSQSWSTSLLAMRSRVARSLRRRS